MQKTQPLDGDVAATIFHTFETKIPRMCCVRAFTVFMCLLFYMYILVSAYAHILSDHHYSDDGPDPMNAPINICFGNILRKMVTFWDTFYIHFIVHSGVMGLCWPDVSFLPHHIKVVHIFCWPKWNAGRRMTHHRTTTKGKTIQISAKIPNMKDPIYMYNIMFSRPRHI